MRKKLAIAIGILLTAGILFTILPLNGIVVSASEASFSSNTINPSIQDQVLNDNSASDAKIKNKVI